MNTKLILYVALLIPLLASAQFGLRSPGFVGALNKATGGSGGNCPVDGSPSVSQVSSAGFNKVGAADTTFYLGQQWPADQVERRICKVAFSYEKSGSPESKVWKCSIFQMSGDDLGALVANGESETVTGLNSATQADVFFTFSTPPTLAANTAYGIVMHLASGSSDASNSVYLYRTATEGGTIIGTMKMWDSTKTLYSFYANSDMSIKIYYYE